MIKRTLNLKTAHILRTLLCIAMSLAAFCQKAAAQQGLKAVHIPISGGIGEGALIRMEQVLAESPKPIFGYCRSGGRAGSLYGAARQAARR